MRLVAKISVILWYGKGTSICGALVGSVLGMLFLTSVIEADPAPAESGDQQIERSVLEQREKNQPLMPVPAAPDRRPATVEPQLPSESFPNNELEEDDYIGPDYGEDDSKTEIEVEKKSAPPVETRQEPVKSTIPPVKELKNVIQDTPVTEKSIKRGSKEELLDTRPNVIETKSRIKNSQTEIQIADEFTLNPDDYVFYDRPEMRKKSSEQNALLLETDTVEKEKPVVPEPEIPGKGSPLLDRIFGISDSKNKNILNLVILCILLFVFLMYRIRNGGSGRKFS